MSSLFIVPESIKLVHIEVHLIVSAPPPSPNIAGFEQAFEINIIHQAVGGDKYVYVWLEYESV